MLHGSGHLHFLPLRRSSPTGRSMGTESALPVTARRPANGNGEQVDQAIIASAKRPADTAAGPAEQAPAQPRGEGGQHRRVAECPGPDQQPLIAVLGAGPTSLVEASMN